jgi:hypothetical protein
MFVLVTLGVNYGGYVHTARSVPSNILIAARLSEISVVKWSLGIWEIVQLVIGLLETSKFTRTHEPKHKNETKYE